MLSFDKADSCCIRRTICFLRFSIFFLCLAASSRAGIASSTISSSQKVDVSHDDVIITPGDRLIITVFDTPEFSGPARVNNDGTINLPLIGSIHIGGLSVTSAANLIREDLISGHFLKDPQVTVNFEDFTNHNAVLLGEVVHPGSVPLMGLRTLWEVLGAAGGVSPTAGAKVTILHKGDSSSPEVFDIDWNRDLAGQSNPVIAPGDTIQVSRAGIVYVLGEVGRQGGYPITHQHMTVSEAIALAEGVKYTSKASHGRLVRSKSSSRIVTEINIPAIIQGKIPDEMLQDNDVIYVPNSASKVAILRGLQAAVGITSSVIVYRNQ